MSGSVAEPTAAELAAIEAGWPVTAAEVAVVDAEVRIACAPGEPSPLDLQELRRARRQVLAARLRQPGRSAELEPTLSSAVAS